MGRKPKKRPTHIRNADFVDRNYSAIESHPRKGATLASPFSKVGPVHLTRWTDEALPNVLWMALLTAALPRDRYLQLFRSVLQDLRDRVPGRKELLLTHGHLATATDEEFDAIFGSVLDDADASYALSALRLIETLPDRLHWERATQEPTPEAHWSLLTSAIGKTFDHQGEAATDMRWLKVMAVIVGQERMVFPKELQDEVVAPILEFPDKGDLKKVRPSIRSLELMCRRLETEEDKRPDVAVRALPPYHGEAFWGEMWRKQKCGSGQRRQRHAGLRCI